MTIAEKLKSLNLNLEDYLEERTDEIVNEVVSHLSELDVNEVLAVIRLIGQKLIDESQEK